MRFLRTNKIYKIVCITGSQDNILGISLGNENLDVKPIQVIEWSFKNIKESEILTSRDEVLRQVGIDL